MATTGAVVALFYEQCKKKGKLDNTNKKLDSTDKKLDSTKRKLDPTDNH